MNTNNALLQNAFDNLDASGKVIDVLMGYIRDGLSDHDQKRLATELQNRGLSDHNLKRGDALTNLWLALNPKA